MDRGEERRKSGRNETASMPKYVKWQGGNIREMGRGCLTVVLWWAAALYKVVREDVISGSGPCDHLGKGFFR